MSEFGGLWKHQNNPACTKNARVFSRMLKMDTKRKKKKRPVTAWLFPDANSTLQLTYEYIACNRQCAVTLSDTE